MDEATHARTGGRVERQPAAATPVPSAASTYLDRPPLFFDRAPSTAANPAPDIQTYLSRNAARAERVLERTGEILLLGAAGIGALAGLGIFLVTSGTTAEHAFIGGVVALIAGAQTHMLVAEPLRDWHAQNVADTQAQVRTNLLDHGLLRLALEPDPFDRLPQLPVSGLIARLQWFNRRKPQDSGKLADRFTDLACSYEGCCRDLMLEPFAGTVRWLAGVISFFSPLWLFIVPSFGLLLNSQPVWSAVGAALFGLGCLICLAMILYKECLPGRAVQLELASILLDDQDAADLPPVSVP